ncbi:SRPBCC family protein [Okibacterium endophyticum]
MSVTYRAIAATPDDVFAVLASGWLYPSWVVGASRIRDVDDAWPAPGSRIFHSIGTWPLLINDSTSVLEWDPPRHVRFRARGWPLGEATISIDVKPRGEGDECVVRMAEDASRGPGRFVPSVVRQVGIHYRNTESLKRLAYLAEGGAR